MEDKKGFTLVELLAVIAILAIILLLIVPNIVDMFNNGKKDAFIRQVQSVWREAEKEYTNDLTSETVTQIYSDSVSNLGRELKLNKTDIKYVVGLDIHGVINYIAVGNKNYCYVKANPSTMDINREELTEGTLNCTSDSCTCGSITASVPENNSSNNNSGNNGGSVTPVTKYVYWSTEEGGYDILYPKNQMPSVTYDSYYDLNNSEPLYFIRTTVVGETPTKHEACMVYNDQLFCIAPNYWDGELGLYENMYRLRDDMQNAFSKESIECDSTASYLATCNISGTHNICQIYDWGDAFCQASGRLCVVTYDGEGKC